MRGNGVPTLLSLSPNFGGQKLKKYLISALIEGALRGAFPHLQIQLYNTDYIHITQASFILMMHMLSLILPRTSGVQSTEVQ